MNVYERGLLERLEVLQHQAKALRLTLRLGRYPCACSPAGCCPHHTLAWNGLLEVEDTVQETIRALKVSAYQQGMGEYDTDEEPEEDAVRDVLEELLRDVEIDLPGDEEPEA